jgi:hypothetical protein
LIFLVGQGGVEPPTLGFSDASARVLVRGP